jgi:hypothetical protein
MDRGEKRSKRAIVTKRISRKAKQKSERKMSNVKSAVPLALLASTFRAYVDALVSKRVARYPAAPPQKLKQHRS